MDNINIVALPSKPNIPKQNLGDYIICIIGENKVGKTALASMFPKSFTMECAPGNADHLKILKQDIHNWQEARDVVTLLTKNPNYCDTVIIDEVDQLYWYCYHHVRQLYKKDDTEKDDFDVWRTIRNLFNNEIKRLIALKKGLIFTTHTSVKEYTDRGGNVTHRVESSLSSQCFSVLGCLVTCWFIMQFTSDGNREMIIEGDDFIKAGHGFSDHFLDQNGNRIKKIPLGKNPMQAYGNLIMAFNNKLQVNVPQQKGK